MKKIGSSEQSRIVSKNTEPTATEILQASEILSRLPEGQPLSRILFTEIARLVVTPIIEFVPIKIIDDRIQILLIPRETDDPLWPSMLHTPGIAFRPSDTGFEEPFKRLLNGELGDVEVLSIDYAGIQLHQSERGNELKHIFYGEINESSLGTYYPVDALPSNIITSQLSMIGAVVSEYATKKHISRPNLVYPKADLIKLVLTNPLKSDKILP